MTTNPSDVSARLREFADHLYPVSEHYVDEIRMLAEAANLIDSQAKLLAEAREALTQIGNDAPGVRADHRATAMRSIARNALYRFNAFERGELAYFPPKLSEPT